MAIANALPRTNLATQPGSWFGFVLACNLVGFLSAMVAGGNQQAFYASLDLPSWAPPGVVFGPVWTALYTLMGVATYLVWRDGAGEPRRAAITAFAVQLALNAMWTPIFFGLHLVGLSVAILIAVVASVVAMIIFYHRVRPLAAALLVPLLAWTTFAAVLDIAIWFRN